MEFIKYSLFGLQLQEPMAFITNGLIAIFCIYAFRTIRNEAGISIYWKQFYLMLAISSILGMYGHTFFHYTYIAGKTPSWVFATIANVCAGMGMLEIAGIHAVKSKWAIFILLKSCVLLMISMVKLKFLFVACDAISTYLLFTGYLAIKLKMKGMKEMGIMIAGVVVMLPSAIFFLMKINPHRWLNKDDISHLLILGGITCFYISIRKLKDREVHVYANV